MVLRVKIVAGTHGVDYTFTWRNVDYSNASGYTVKLYVWRGDTVLVDGGTCTATYDGTNTIVTYTTEDVFNTVGVWNAYLVATKSDFEDKTLPFEWEVVEGHPED